MTFFASWGPSNWLMLGIILGLAWAERRNVQRGRRVGRIEGLVKQLVALSAGKVVDHDGDDTKP